eukprot:TRINITY_DN2197_c0_g1_i5.p1 TRINITY_DN2197_c0_g1~~TRINITY_DN2197_c0_g1_i5.p1  ORF type:complete len:315 (+),score=23.92 TRINITY_DN2197_c0_g1_i5:112-1056(+)
MRIDVIVAIVCGALSLVGSFILIVTYFLFKDLGNESVSRQLIFYLSLADFGQGIFFVMYGLESHSLSCAVMSVYGIFTAVSSFLWTVCIAHYVWRMVSSPQERLGYPYWYHIISWGYPALYLCILLVTKPNVFSRDEDVGWCFMPRSERYLRVATIYAPLAICWILTFVYYFLARRQVQQMREMSLFTPFAREKQNAVQEVLNKLTLIPLGFIFLRIWGCLYRFTSISWDDNDSSLQDRFYWLEVLTSFGDPSQGIFNFFVFVVFTKKVRDRYHAILYRLMGWDELESTPELHQELRPDHRMEHHHPPAPPLSP